MNSKPAETFSIYRSSAGSGKTHQLAIEFVSMAVKDPGLFNKILAVTFTNKATKEMKERILSFLIKLANKEDAELLAQVIEKTNLTPEAVATNAKIVIGKILHQYSQFSISTIDAFFQKIVKSFAKELGLFGNFKVELDQDKIKLEVIDQIIDELGVDKDLTNWLVDFSFSKVDENKSWNIRPQIETLANEVFKESFRRQEKSIHEIDRALYKHFLNQVRKIKTQFERHMKSKASQALDLIRSHGLSVDDFTYKGSGPAGYFDRILKKLECDPKKRVLDAIGDPEKWYSKSSLQKDEIQRLVEAGLQDLTISLVDHYTENIQEYTTASEILRNLHVFGILSQIIKKLKEYRSEHDLMLISDVAVFLNEIIAENETPFIYEKTGTWYQHFLIDEFQDTSDFQWQNFKPLVENSISQEHKSLLVGDGKQSIYRWRGGDWNLILNQVGEDLHQYNPIEKHLNTNWRSARNIVEFNNKIFGYLPTLISRDLKNKIDLSTLPSIEKEKLSSLSSDVVKLYEDVVQNVAIKNLEPSTGKIEINVYQKDDSSPWKESVIEELPLAIERLQDAGFEARDIAVLVRKSGEGKQVMERLIKYSNSAEAKKGYCYKAISNESLFLGNASVIRLLINTIKYGINPADKISFGEICYNYRHLYDDENSTSANNDLQFILEGEELPDDFINETKSLIRLPPYEMVERIIQLFDLGSAKHKGYFQAFQDVVLDYFSGESKDIHDFLSWWDDKGKRTAVQMPQSVNAIRIMTIHKSKGLEFKAVLIPFCNWSLDHEATKDNFMWCKTDKKPFDEMGYLPLKYSSKLGGSYFAQEYFEEMLKAHIDNLNLLYVALTRVEKYLLINCPPQSPGGIKNAGDLVINAVETIMQSQEEGDILVSIKEEVTVNRYSIGSIEGSETIAEMENQESKKSTYESSDWRQKIAIRKKGAFLFGPDASEKKAKINYGLIVHEILACIRDENEAEIVLEKYYVDGQISSEDRKTIRDQLDRLFSNVQVQPWFNTDWEVKTEVPIILKVGQPKRPDRVLLLGKKAIIIDFKTGVEKSIDKKQVLEYKGILEEMGYQEIQAYLLYISLDKVIKIA